ncbi:MAG: YARHG domain-containing protein [Saprospiraceae bacterium]|nr:YARHG domain-containing protein [Saprospiraceae bacterium]
MRIPVILFLLACLSACNSSPTTTESAEATPEQAETPESAPPSDVPETKPTSAPVASSEQRLAGYYIGDFEAAKLDESQNYSYSNRINISIERMGDGQISGRSIVAGNDRPFSGTYTAKENGTFEVEAKEPGDDKYDGVFSFQILPKGEKIVGTWKANNGSLAVSEREYVLEKRTFSYDPNNDLPEDVSWAQLYNGEHPEEFLEEAESLSEDVLKFNPSKVALKKEDVENMFRGDLEIMRNSIYARHGYSFKNRKMRYIFDHYVEWYIPVSVDIRNELTALEKQNIELIKRYEEHAEKYYDYFGR